MLKSVLRYIRQKPKVVRNQYALALAAVFTVGVIFVWLVSGGSALDGTGSPQKASEGNTPFSNLIKQAKDQFAFSKAAFPKAEQATSSVNVISSSSASGEMILSVETLEGIDEGTWSASTSASSTTNYGYATENEATTTSSMQYIEVQIVTTTTAPTTSATSPQ